MLAVFDKKTKKFKGYACDGFEDTTGELETKEIPEEQSGTEWSWRGDMDTGKMTLSKNYY